MVKVPEDINEAIAKARSTVVTSFLTSSEFQEIVPAAVAVPPPAPYGSRGITLVVSMATVLITLLLALVSM